jgi:hypothetical protein
MLRFESVMAKKSVKEPVKTQPKAPPRQPMSDAAKAQLRKVVGHSLAAIAFAGVCAGGFMASQRYVERVARTDQPPEVVIADQPAWMSPALADQIVSNIRPRTPFSPGDQQMLADHAKLLAANPWVKEVHAVRRAYRDQPGDVIEVRADFRAPVALVRWQDAYWYVDSDGVRLPERLTAEQAATLIQPGRPTMFRIIDGVTSAPASPGKPWPGGEVQAGIELIGLLTDRIYDQIVKIDVSNFNGRQSANGSQINLVTRDGSEVRWGQAPSAKSFFNEQRVDRKLEYMKQAVQQTGRVDMNQKWIDLRFDNVTVPDRRSHADAGH